MEIIDADDFDDLSAQWLLEPGAALPATPAAA